MAAAPEIIWMVLYGTVCIAWTGKTFTEDPNYVNKSVTGDAVVTLTDVTSVTCAIRCSSKYPCVSFAYNARDRVCSYCALCNGFRLVDAPGFTFYVMTKEHVDPSYDQANACPDIPSIPQKCWKLSDGLLTHVSVGPVGVWGLNHLNNIYYRQGTYQDPASLGTDWIRITGGLNQLDVGTVHVWGINDDGRFFYRQSITASYPAGTGWSGQGGNLQWVSVTPQGSLWVVNTTGRIYHAHNSSHQQPFGTGWDLMGGNVKLVDAGQAGVWTVNTSGHLEFREGTEGGTGSTGTNWRDVPGTFQSVASGRDVVVAVDTAGLVWLRVGLGPDTPAGLAWVRYPGRLQHIDVYQTSDKVVMWGVAADQEVFFSTFSDS